LPHPRLDRTGMQVHRDAEPMVRGARLSGARLPRLLPPALTGVQADRVVGPSGPDRLVVLLEPLHLLLEGAVGVVDLEVRPGLGDRARDHPRERGVRLAGQVLVTAPVAPAVRELRQALRRDLPVSYHRSLRPLPARASARAPSGEPRPAPPP